MKRKGLLMAILICGILLLLTTGYYIDSRVKTESTPPNHAGEPYIEVSMDGQHVPLVGKVVEEWTKWEDSAMDLYDKYRAQGRVYTAKSVMINWGIFDIPEGTSVKKQYFELSKEKDFVNVDRYDLSDSARNINLFNLEVDTEYYFRITVEFENHKVCAAEGSFQTKWSPRIIEFENLRNIRDIGGWKTVDEKKVKQGLLYRGCELDAAIEAKYRITEAGVDKMRNVLGVKTELDLRAPWVTHPLVPEQA